MTSLLAWIFATIITVPLLGFVLVFSILRLVVDQKRRAFHYSIDITTLLLIISVYFLGQVVFGISLFAHILIFTLVLAIIFVFINWKINEEVKINKVIKGVWRCNFLVFLVIYLVFIVYGIVERVWEL
ncbi:hypothetical protein JOC85_000234 [Bacillus mesophilus]|uniref:DUF3397 domain-containing protein n=1 Tax=Bacillus mesophilus TaxID=1808955 RepID=A0A6M0Q4G3_9BACI|nr:DUF3397 domain-containing protein [Bacillus mesophilus]MBM7659467.1 hypothetical protein [Bacillus mesophilus]NEY70340.1 DUF3397 domain-containing protein [Bacillus mesophilus]